MRAEEFPVWTRPDQIAFFATQPRPADAHYVHETGGSTGIVARFYITRESYEWRTAIMDRVYGWAGAEEGARSVHVWSTPRKKSRTHALKILVHSTLQRRTYFDAYREFTDRERSACCELINRVKPRAIVGYTGTLVDLARFAREHRMLHWRSPSLISTAETLQAGQRELLQAEIAHEVFDSYGSREFMNIATECEVHAGYHIATDNLRVEVVDRDGHAVEPGVEGRVVVTDLRNAANPFIRYDVGDMGIMAPPGESCPCGRPFPLLRSIQGRAQDVIYTPRGQISALYIEDVMENVDWIEGFQMWQPSRDALIIRFLARVAVSDEMLRPVRDRVLAKLGQLHVTFEPVNELTRLPNGKVERVRSEVHVA